jgi:hypothetical protein
VRRHLVGEAIQSSYERGAFGGRKQPFDPQLVIDGPPVLDVSFLVPRFDLVAGSLVGAIGALPDGPRGDARRPSDVSRLVIGRHEAGELHDLVQA